MTPVLALLLRGTLMDVLLSEWDAASEVVILLIWVDSLFLLSLTGVVFYDQDSEGGISEWDTPHIQFTFRYVSQSPHTFHWIIGCTDTGGMVGLDIPQVGWWVVNKSRKIITYVEIFMYHSGEFHMPLSGRIEWMMYMDEYTIFPFYIYYCAVKDYQEVVTLTMGAVMWFGQDGCKGVSDIFIETFW